MQPEDRIIKKLNEQDQHFARLFTKINEHDEHFSHLFKKLNEHDGFFAAIFKKLGEHDGYFATIFKKFGEHDSNFGAIFKKLNEHDGNFAALFKTQDQVSKTQDKLIQKVMEIDEKIDTLATKDEVCNLDGRVMSVLDHHTKMLENLDQERLAMISRIERLEGASPV